jgi:hypothetical protein
LQISLKTKFLKKNCCKPAKMAEMKQVKRYENLSKWQIIIFLKSEPGRTCKNGRLSTFQYGNKQIK